MSNFPALRELRNSILPDFHASRRAAVVVHFVCKSIASVASIGARLGKDRECGKSRLPEVLRILVGGSDALYVLGVNVRVKLLFAATAPVAFVGDYLQAYRFTGRDLGSNHHEHSQRRPLLGPEFTEVRLGCDCGSGRI